MSVLKASFLVAARDSVATMTVSTMLPNEYSSMFRVPDRGSGNPTPLGGMGPSLARCTLGHGELQTRQPYGLGLQVPHCMGCEIPVPDPWGRCGTAMP